MTDPGDEMTVLAVSSPKFGIRGIMVNVYGAYCDFS